MEPGLQRGIIKEFSQNKKKWNRNLQEYQQDHASMSEDLSIIQVSYLEDPYKEICWLFT